jgi:hypothetical protein
MEITKSGSWGKLVHSKNLKTVLCKDCMVLEKLLLNLHIWLSLKMLSNNNN